MTRILSGAVFAVIVLVAGVAAHSAFGQEPGRDAIQVSRDGDVVTTPELFRRIFEGEGATVHLRRSGEGVTAAEIISPQGGELTFPGLNMVAGRLSMDLLTRAVTAEGGVTITTTSEDGSTVTMRSDRMVIESQ